MATGMIGQAAPKPLLSPDALLASMHVTPQQRTQLERIVAAGGKVMFSQQTHSMFLDRLQAPGPIEQKLADGIAALMQVLWNESKGSLPPELMIPAALVLMAHAVDYLQKAGQKLTPEQIGAANELMVTKILAQGKVSSDKLVAAVDRGAAAGQPQQPQGVTA